MFGRSLSDLWCSPSICFRGVKSASYVPRSVENSRIMQKLQINLSLRLILLLAGFFCKPRNVAYIWSQSLLLCKPEHDACTWLEVWQCVGYIRWGDCLWPGVDHHPQALNCMLGKVRRKGQLWSPDKTFPHFCSPCTTLQTHLTVECLLQACYLLWPAPVSIKDMAVAWGAAHCSAPSCSWLYYSWYMNAVSAETALQLIILSHSHAHPLLNVFGDLQTRYFIAQGDCNSQGIPQVPELLLCMWDGAQSWTAMQWSLLSALLVCRSWVLKLNYYSAVWFWTIMSVMWEQAVRNYVIIGF